MPSTPTSVGGSANQATNDVSEIDQSLGFAQHEGGDDKLTSSPPSPCFPEIRESTPSSTLSDSKFFNSLCAFGTDFVDELMT